MRITFVTITLIFAGLGSATLAQDLQVPPSLLQPPGAQVPAALVPPNTNLLSHTLTAKDAAAAWDELTSASHRPDPPAAWQSKEPTDKEQVDFFMPYVLALMDKSKDFYTRFPTNAHASDARMQEFQITTVAVEQLGATNQRPRLDTEEKALLADPGLAEDDRLTIRVNDVERDAKAKEPQGEAATVAEFEKGVRVLQKEFPKRPEVMQMLLQIAANSEPAKARGLFQEITNSAVASDEVKSDATSELKKLDTLGKPVALAFTAVDGRAVDVSSMKGKVVLVDFWATWCAPCVEEMPDVKAAYDKNHAKGFEIVGISLDDDKDSLKEFVSSHQMAWPQYFDGLKMGNKYAQQFGIDGVPTMWLIDKKGNLCDLNARMDLNSKIEKLLAE